MNYACRNGAPERLQGYRGADCRVDVVAYPPDHRQPRHAHEALGISLVLEGRLFETVKRRRIAAGPLSLVIKPPGVFHANEIGPQGARLLQLALQPASIPREHADGLGRWRWWHTGIGLERVIALARGLRTRATPAALDSLVTEVVGGLSGATAPRGVAPGWLKRVREALDDLPQSGLTTRRLAEIAGLHPVSLARAFRRQYGVSVSRYRRLVRLRCAVGEMRGRGTLADIAQESGYADQSHLCRDMRALAGIRPSSFRRILLPGRH